MVQSCCSCFFFSLQSYAKMLGKPVKIILLEDPLVGNAKQRLLDESH